MSTVRARLRFLGLYYACWLPYAIIYGLALLVQRPEARVVDAVSVGLWALIWTGTLGLGVRWSVRRTLDRRFARVRNVLAFVVTIVTFAACNSAGTILSIWYGAPPDVLINFLRYAVWWDVVSGLTMGALLVAIFSVMHAQGRLQEHRRAAQRANELRVRAELQALRARLDPHFLFNTLHSITALVRTDAGTAQAALERFGTLMRYVLDSERNQRDEVTLEDELAFIRSYLELERLRLGDRLRVVEEIHEEALECHLPALTLQPLVENAIRHGIAPRARGGTLRMAAHVDGDRLEILIGDDGAGGDPTAVAAGDGVGFRVVQQRLLARYGDAARVDVTAAPQEGWLVRISMPAIASASRARATAAT